MGNEIKNEEKKIDELKHEFDELQLKLEETHNYFIGMASMSGFALDAVKIAKNNFQTMFTHIDNYPEYSLLINSAYTQIASINQNFPNFDSDWFRNEQEIEIIARSLRTTCSTSASVVRTIDKNIVSYIDTPSFLKVNSDAIFQKLLNLSQPLANTYKEIEQVLYATNADNTRGAMSMTRQAFDHFFDILAPDDEVRDSDFWEEKTGTDKPNQVYRRERIKYAIANHIDNEKIAANLSNDMTLIIDSYNVLNKLHKRGKMDDKSAKKNLFAVKNFLEDFANSLR